jgi:hypothetical protein
MIPNRRPAPAKQKSVFAALTFGSDKIMVKQKTV